MRFNRRIRRLIFPLHIQATRLWRPCVFSGGPPSGLFLEAENLYRGAVNGRVVFDGQTLPEIPAGSEIHEAGLDQDKHSRWVSLWTQRNDVFLAGPSLAHIDNSGRVSSEAVYGPHAWADPVWQRKSSRPVRELAGNHTSIVSRWNNGRNYYHWFLDGLARLVHLSTFPDDCKILVPRDMPGFAIRSLELLGLTERLVETGGEDLRIERYWFAGPTMLSGCPDPAGVSWLRQHLMLGQPSQRTRLLYVERKASTRNLSNAREVAALFRQRGWEIVDPAALSLDEQMRIFSEARAVVGTHGAAFTNLLWAAPGTQVLEFMPSLRRNGCYAGICLIGGLSHQAMVIPSTRNGEMRIPIESLDSIAAKMEISG